MRLVPAGREEIYRVASRTAVRVGPLYNCRMGACYSGTGGTGERRLSVREKR